MLCYFSHQFPQFVAAFIQNGRKLRRRFREESVTDLLMGSLMTIGGARVIVEFPDEVVTGADMQWDFANRDNGTFLRLLIQAKQLYGEGSIWSRHNYSEILRPSGAAGKAQADVLCDTARNASAPTVPIYLFYNPLTTCDLAAARGVKHLRGVNWCDGYRIERLVKAAAADKKLRTRNKSLAAIHPYLLSLPDLFCPPLFRAVGPMARWPGAPFGGLAFPWYGTVIAIGPRGLMVPIPPRPEDIRQRLAQARERVDEYLAEEVTFRDEGAAQRDMATDELTPLPEISQTIPPDVMARIERRESDERDERDEKPTRWRVTFVSFNPTASETD